MADAIDAKFRNAGQTCVCASRVLVQDRVHDEFEERYAAAGVQLAVGPGRGPGVAIGPLIDEAAVAKVEWHIAAALPALAEAGVTEIIVDIDWSVPGAAAASGALLRGAT